MWWVPRFAGSSLGLKSVVGAKVCGSSLGLKSVGGAKVCGVKPWTEKCGRCQGLRGQALD